MDMAEQGAAVLADDDEKSFAEAIITILSDKKLYVQMRQAAITIAKSNTWEHQFAHAFEDMQKSV